jgi:hypothetical protein
MIRYERVKCADGFSMSVQANFGAYCEPREDNALEYEEVEVGYPSVVEPLLNKWAESPDRPTDTVYGYVPVDVVRAVILKHGGIVSGQIPPGVL